MKNRCIGPVLLVLAMFIMPAWGLRLKAPEGCHACRLSVDARTSDVTLTCVCRNCSGQKAAARLKIKTRSYQCFSLSNQNGALRCSNQPSLTCRHGASVRCKPYYKQVPGKLNSSYVSSRCTHVCLPEKWTGNWYANDMNNVSYCQCQRC